MINVLSAKNVYDLWASECECLEVIDFRSDNEIRVSRIPGANNLDPIHVNAETFLEFENKVFVLIDAPSDFLSEVSKNLDIDNVFVIDGGFGSWIDGGYPIAPLVFNGEVKKYG